MFFNCKQCYSTNHLQIFGTSLSTLTLARTFPSPRCMKDCCSLRTYVTGSLSPTFSLTGVSDQNKGGPTMYSRLWSAANCELSVHIDDMLQHVWGFCEMSQHNDSLATANLLGRMCISFANHIVHCCWQGQPLGGRFSIFPLCHMLL